MQGNTKNTPGPRAPPDLLHSVRTINYYSRDTFVRAGKFNHLKRPIRKITARSNSDTTLKHRNSENGNVSIISRPENSVEKISMHPDRLPSAKQENGMVEIKI